MHADERALLAAYAECSDEAHRLVLADWLDEHDDPRGAWLRDAELAHFMGPTVSHPAVGMLTAWLNGDASIADRLIALGPSVVPHIILEADGQEELFSIADAIRDAVPGLSPLCQRLTADDPRVRFDAVRAIGELGEPGVACVWDLARLIRDADPAVSVAVVETFSHFGHSAPVCLRVAWGRMVEVDHEVARCLLRAAEGLGPHSDAVEILIHCVALHGETEREPADTALRSLGIAVAPRILASYDRVVSRNRQAVSDILRGFGPDVLPLLLQVSADASALQASREGAVLALGAFADMPEQAKPIVTHLADLLVAPHRDVHWCVLAALQTFGEWAASAVPALVPILADENSQEAALAILLAVGPAAVDALSAVRPLLARLNPTVREQAEQLVTRFLDRDAVPAQVRHALQSTDEAERMTAVEMLARFAADMPDAAECLQRALADPSSAVRLAGLRHLSRLNDYPKQIESLRTALHDTDAEVRVSSVHLTLRDHEAISTLYADLMPLFNDLSARVREAVARIARWSGRTPAIRSALFAGLDDADRNARWAALWGLSHWSDTPAEMVPALLRHLHHDDEMLVSFAADRLARIRPTPTGVPEALHALLYRSPLLAVEPLREIGFTPTLADREPLLRALNSHDSMNTRIAIEMLVLLGEAIVPDLIVTLQSPDLDLEALENPAIVLAEIGPAAHAALPALEARTRTGWPSVAAIQAIARIAPLAEAIERLRPCLTHSNEFARLLAWQALQAMGESARFALPELTERSRHENKPSVREVLTAMLATLDAVTSPSTSRRPSPSTRG